MLQSTTQDTNQDQVRSSTGELPNLPIFETKQSSLLAHLLISFSWTVLEKKILDWIWDCQFTMNKSCLNALSYLCWNFTVLALCEIASWNLKTLEDSRAFAHTCYDLAWDDPLTFKLLFLIISNSCPAQSALICCCLFAHPIFHYGIH